MTTTKVARETCLSARHIDDAPAGSECVEAVRFDQKATERPRAFFVPDTMACRETREALARRHAT